MVAAGQAAQRQQHDEEQRRRREADDDGRQHQRLRQRVAVVDEVGRHAHLDDGFASDRQAADAEDEQVDRVRKQRQADQHLEGPRPQHQPHAGTGHHPDRDGDHHFHQPSLPSAGGRPCRRRARSDWWAMAVSSSRVEPTTTANTPRSKIAAVGRCTSPTSGQVTCAVCVVRKGWPSASEPSPVASAISKPIAIQRVGSRCIRSSTQRVPLTMY
mmetsp:Transcript_44565/g.104710  ORF Transcript_44565/g.104710 Transcript_44565/m.104710 type:complete len:214 (+) Transcript_44565:4635-5276(+)